MADSGAAADAATTAGLEIPVVATRLGGSLRCADPALLVAGPSEALRGAKPPARDRRQTIASFVNRRYLRAMLIYKILRRPEWDAFRAAGQTAGAPIDLADGYIHFSTAAQVAETAAKWFATESDLVLVAFEADRLGPALKWEPSRGGQLFPHLYRPLKLDEVVWDKSLPLGATGHIFPEGVW